MKLFTVFRKAQASPEPNPHQPWHRRRSFWLVILTLMLIFLAIKKWGQQLF